MKHTARDIVKLRNRHNKGHSGVGVGESPTHYGDHFVSDEETGFLYDNESAVSQGKEDQEHGQSMEDESWDDDLITGRMD